MREDAKPDAPALRIDGGMAADDWLGPSSSLSVLVAPVERPVQRRRPTLGAALCGVGDGRVERYRRAGSDCGG